MSIYSDITEKAATQKKIALLIDPDKHTDESLDQLIKIIRLYPPQLLLVGGSLSIKPIQPVIEKIKSELDIPVVLFPGNLLQISDKADGILFLSLISGRNPELLIGNQVIAAPILKRSKLEVIPTGYILVSNGKTTSVEYMSNTSPIPSDKADIAVATAMAGELMGLKLIYLESGSGANSPSSVEMIRAIKDNIEIPLIVGGGIRTAADAQTAFNAGADIVVIGTVIEENPEKLKEFQF